MSLPLGFTAKQLTIWGMRRDSLRQVEIARRLGVSRQAISKAMRRIDDKVSRSLEAAAKAAKIEARYIDPLKGVLLGYSHETDDRVVVTFSTRHGAHIWHYYTGRCDGCGLLETCGRVILDEAEERGIALAEEEKDKSPAEIAHLVFSKVIPGLEP